MNKHLRYIMIMMAMGASIATYAQNSSLSKEITIETDFVPDEQKATKLNVLPATIKTTVAKASLANTDWWGAVELPYTIKKYDAYCYNADYQFSQSRGYADLGVGTQLNMVGNLGYRFIDNSTTTLKAWYQNLSTWCGKNSSPLAEDNAKKQKYNDNVLAVDFENIFSAGTLTASALYHLDNFNYYGAEVINSSADAPMQTINEVDVRLGWNSHNDEESKVKYSGELVYNHFGYTRGVSNLDGGVKENAFLFSANAEVPLNSINVGANAAFSYVDDAMNLDKHHSYTMLTLTPYASYQGDKLRLLVGVNLDISANDGAVLRFAPKVKASYSFGKAFEAYAHIDGGKRLNLLANYHSQCRYINPLQPIGTSYTSFDGRFGVKIGPVRGFYLSPYFAYGVFKNAPLPINNEPSAYVIVGSVNMKGWSVGAEMGYKYGNLVDFKANVQYAPQEGGDGYTTGLDRAVLVADAQVKVKPIKPLAITLGYEARIDRANYSPMLMVDDGANTSAWSKTKLADVGNLSLNAYYQMNEKLGFFVDASNLLNKQWDIFHGMGAQKLNILAGVNYVF